MILPLDPRGGLILIPTRVFTPNGQAQTIVRLAVDTGSTASMLNWDIATKLGYDPLASRDRIQTITVAGSVVAPRIVVSRIEALGRSRTDFPILCHTLSPDTGVDGVLGLDFFRGRKLTIDLRVGIVTLE